ncbi:MAG: ComEC/Rec2 family competence protein [Candidatus Auribacterota bacterium]|nr:ComEC/Rec2 family competence protein [Candidatus Auribacterota bacterium]
MIYPIVKITLLFILGVVAGQLLPGGKNFFILSGLISAVTLITYIHWKKMPTPWTRRVFIFFLGMFIVSLGIWRYSLAVRPKPDDISRFISPSPSRVTGTIRGDPIYRRHNVHFELLCEKIRRGKVDLPATGILQVLFHGQVKEVEPVIRCGNRIEIAGKIARPRDRGNPGEISRRERLASRSIYALTRIYHSRDLLLLDETGRFSLTCLALKLKDRLQEIIEATLPGPGNHPGSLQSTMLEGLMLGERSAIPYEIKEKFRSVGVIHVLVVSGLHVGFIWGLGALIFSPLPLRIRHALLIPLVAGYVLMTGASTATVRAGLMACVYSLAFVLNQPRNALTSIAAAALGLLIYNPLSLFQAGFQLSFMIVLSIISLTPIIDRRLRFLPARLRPYIGVPLAAQLGALPLVSYYFHYISLIALPANIIVVLLVAGIVCLGFTASLAGLIALPLAWLLNYPNRFLILLLLKLVGWFSRIPWSGLRITPFPVIWIFIWYLIILSPILLRFRSRRRLWSAGIILILLLIGWGACYLPAPTPPPFQAIFFNSESGDQTLLREAAGTTILITSDDDRFNDIGKIITPYLAREKIEVIDYLVLTGANLDHLNVINKLLEIVTIGTVLDHPLGPSSPSYTRFRTVLEENNIDYRRLNHDDLIEIGESRLTVLWPRCKAGTKFQPDYSLVVRLRFGETTFLFPSRIGILAQEELAEEMVNLKATIFKAPWRGSSAHISPFFLKAIHPEYGLLIQGRKYFGRYPRDCGEFLKEQGAKIHKTGEEGCITVETDGSSCRVLSTFHN